MLNQTKTVYFLTILPLILHIKHTILEYSVDKGLHLIEILLKILHILYETLGIPAYIVCV